MKNPWLRVVRYTVVSGAPLVAPTRPFLRLRSGARGLSGGRRPSYRLLFSFHFIVSRAFSLRLFSADNPDSPYANYPIVHNHLPRSDRTGCGVPTAARQVLAGVPF